MTQTRQLPSMPPVGRPESFYARQAQHAERAGDTHAHEAYKVGQYVTLGLDSRLPWPKQLKFFDHALRRHCATPPLPDEDIWLFYRSLADLVRTHAGETALRLASAKDDEYADRVAAGGCRHAIAEEARRYFMELTTLTDAKPPHFNDVDWAQLRLIREQWI